MFIDVECRIVDVMMVIFWFVEYYDVFFEGVWIIWVVEIVFLEFWVDYVCFYDC